MRSLVTAGCFLFLWSCSSDESHPPPAWDKGLPKTADVYVPRRGLTDVRGIIHLHSVYSHDACDGDPLPGGQPAQPCHQDLRDALCTTHQDFAFLTDHAASMAAQDWPLLFQPMPGDQAIMKNGVQIASQFACPDGFRVLAMVGGENDLMPIGLESEVDPDPTVRDQIMTGTDHTSSDVFRAHGALVLVAHGESHTVAQLLDVAADGTEMYNIHANIDPKIRSMYLGLTGAASTAPITNLGTAGYLTNRKDAPEPDTAFLAMFEENPMELGLIEALWGMGKHLTGTVGCDAHENAVAVQLSDGERGDSYRRFMRWFSNHLLVTELSPDGLKTAIKSGRAYGAFEIFGTPVGFDYYVQGGGEMGDTAAVGSTLVVEVPKTTDPLRVRILRIDASGSNEVASGGGRLTFVAAQPGVYRAEIRVTPNHLVPYMGFAKDQLLKEFVWVYANPIYVQ